MPRQRIGIFLARAFESVAKIARAVKRVAGAPRKALLKPLEGLPVRLDVINKACPRGRRSVRNVFSHRNPLRLALGALAGGPARRARVVQTIREQPVCGTLIYLLTFECGAKRIFRDPKSYLECRPIATARHAPRDGAPVVSGVKKNKVLSAFAGREDVTRLVARIETSLHDLDFDDLRQYLVSACGVKPGFQCITIVFANLREMVMRNRMATASP